MTRHRRTYGTEGRSRGRPHSGALPATVPGFIVQIYAHCSVKQKADPEANADTDQYVSTPLGLGEQRDAGDPRALDRGLRTTAPEYEFSLNTGRFGGRSRATEALRQKTTFEIELTTGGKLMLTFHSGSRTGVDA